MRFILFLLVNFSLNGYSQDAADYVVLGLIRQGVEEKKLPPELVNHSDSINYPNMVVVVQGTKENGLNSGAVTTYGEVSYAIWTAEELFTLDPYWIIPAKIQRKGSKISFNFMTTYLATERKVCYRGLLKGEILKGKWVVTKCSYRPMTCRYDLRKLAEESNAR